jgi:hypothetical protein
MLAAVQPGNLRCSAWHKVAGKKMSGQKDFLGNGEIEPLRLVRMGP